MCFLALFLTREEHSTVHFLVTIFPSPLLRGAPLYFLVCFFDVVKKMSTKNPSKFFELHFVLLFCGKSEFIVNVYMSMATAKESTSGLSEKVPGGLNAITYLLVSLKLTAL